MAKHTDQTILFKDFFNKKVEADFNGGHISSDGGLLFMQQIECKIGLFSKISNVIHDSRHPSYVKHKTTELLKQRVFQIVAGYEDANDCNALRQDPVLKLSCESDQDLASQPTMSRFENAPGSKTLYRIGLTLVDLFIDSYESPPKGIILDIDDTDDTVYGNQQLSLFNAYHGGYCYMPIHIYEGKSGKLITTILRSGKRPNGKEIVSILKRIVNRLSAAWGDKVGILLRGDAHYSCPEVYDYCNENNINYVLGYKSYETVVNKASCLVNQAKQLYEAKGKPVKLFGEFIYQAASWSTPNRIIVKAEHNNLGPNRRFIVTNLKANNRRFIYKTVYCGRGAMELMIKEHKNHLSSDRTSCGGFAANQFRLFLHSMAYVLMHTYRQNFLQGTEFAKAQFDTIRLKLIKIGARVVQLKTKIKIHLPTACPVKNDLYKIWITSQPPAG